MSFRVFIIGFFLVFVLSACGSRSTTWDWFTTDDEEVVVAENLDEEMAEEEFDEDLEREFEEELEEEFQAEFEDEPVEEFEDESIEEFADEPIEEIEEEPNDGLTDEEFDQIIEDEYGDEPVVEPSEQIRTRTPPRAIVYFDYKSTVVPATGLNLLQLHSQYLINNPELAVTLVGHSDAVASSSYNRKLSSKRAQAVAELLVQMGVDPAQMEVISRGESELAVEGDSEYANAMNRRVELVY